MSTTEPSDSPYATTSSAPTVSRNPAGTAALAVAGAIVAIGLIQQVLLVFVPSIIQSGVSVALYFGTFTVINGVLALIATSFGVIGLTRPGMPRGAAAAGAAIGVSTLLGVLVSMIVNVF